MPGWRKAIAILCALPLVSAASEPSDPANPTCPKHLNWSTYPEMHFTLDTSTGHRVLLGEGAIDQDVALRLDDALKGVRRLGAAGPTEPRAIAAP